LAVFLNLEYRTLITSKYGCCIRANGRNDADGCASALEELLRLRQEHGSEEQVS
jgi:hypothetical protein